MLNLVLYKTLTTWTLFKSTAGLREKASEKEGGQQEEEGGE